MKKLILVIVAVLVGAALLALPNTVWANEKVGIIVASRGSILNSTDHPLLQGSIVYEGDAITAEENSFAVVQLYDGAKVTIKPNSVVTISEYSDEKVTISLVSGGLRMVTGLIGKNNPEDITIETPTALMGVRGTEFSIQLIEE